MRRSIALPAILVACWSVRAAAQAPAPTAQLIAAAVSQARSDQKTVLVEIGASWCGWCHKFEAFLVDSSAGPIMKKHFVEVHLVGLEIPAKRDLENPGLTAYVDSMNHAPHGLENGGIPYFFMLDDHGNKIGDSMAMPDGSNIGHPDLVAEVDAFDRLLRRTAPKMTLQERNVIRAYMERAAGRGKATTE